MKILLVQPAKSPDTIGCEDIFLYEPLALEYLAAPLVEEHDVKIIDLRLEKNLREIFVDFNPHIVGITAYTVHVNIVKDLFKLMKSWNPGVFTVVGGHHATVAYHDFLESYIDLIVMGEGVFVFKEVVSRFEKKLSFKGLTGIAHLKGGEIVIAPPTFGTDLDSYPFPVRYLTNKYRKSYFSEWGKPLATIRTSQGCPFRCSFCALWKLNGGRYLKRKPEKIVEELSGIKEKYIFFADDESLIDTQRISKLANLIKEAGIKKKYFIYGRSDTIVSHPEVIEQWKKIGLERIFIGLEFFRDKDMKEVRKKLSIRDNEEAISILQRLDIKIFGSFIIKPDFTHDDFREFKNYCRRLRLHFPVFSVLTPLPGTAYYEEVKDKLITHNYDYFDLLHSIVKPRLPLKEFYKEFYHLYRNSASTLNRIKLLLEYSPGEILKVIKMSNRIRNGYVSMENL